MNFLKNITRPTFRPYIYRNYRRNYPSRHMSSINDGNETDIKTFMERIEHIKKTKEEYKITIEERKDPRESLPRRIPAGGKESNEMNGHDTSNGSWIDPGTIIQPGWKEGHASQSEAVIKAERHPHRTPDELQKDTMEHFKSREELGKKNSKI